MGFSGGKFATCYCYNVISNPGSTFEGEPGIISKAKTKQNSVASYTIDLIF